MRRYGFFFVVVVVVVSGKRNDLWVSFGLPTYLRWGYGFLNGAAVRCIGVFSFLFLFRVGQAYPAWFLWGVLLCFVFFPSAEIVVSAVSFRLSAGQRRGLSGTGLCQY